MANYEPTDWKDTVKDAQGNVIQKGTPLNASTMKKIEDGIVNTDKRVDDVTTQLAESVEEVRMTNSNPNNFNGAIVTIIDDDARPEFRTVWQPILNDNPDVKIGIAVVKDWTENGSSLSLSELLVLQNNGHDLLCHTAHHEASYLITPQRAEADYPVSKEWMKVNGLKGYEHLVYPGGLNPNSVNVKDVARKHFKYAVSTETAGDYAVTPVDNWCIPRINGDAKTLVQLKDAVDYAKANGIWLILMTHAHVLLTEGSQKMRDFIAYVKSQNVPIMPYTEAIKYKGNAVAVGEFTKQNSTFVSFEGKDNRGISFLTENIIMNNPITAYEKNHVSILNITYLQDTFRSKGGVMEVVRGNNDAYSYARYIPTDKNVIFIRKWNKGNNTWGDWEVTSDLELGSAITTSSSTTMNDSITTYPRNQITVTKVEYTKDTFRSQGGILTTYRFEEDSTAYQSFKLFNSNKLYSRRWISSSSSWEAWTIVGGTDVNAVNNGAILLSDITAFLPDVVSIYPCSTNVNAPESKGGVYTVYNFSDTSYGYAEYKIWNSNVLYRRRWNSGAWTTWEKVSTV